MQTLGEANAEGHTWPMTSAAALKTGTLEALRGLQDELRFRGVRSLYLFGSVARNEAGPYSDVDVFADFEAGARLGWDYAGVPSLLSKRLDRRVDFTLREALHPLLRADIEQQAIRVF